MTTDHISAQILGEATELGGFYRVKNVEAHVRGLRLPGHMGLLPDGRLLVSEYGGRAIRDITDGGDLSDDREARYAWGLSHPAGILPTQDGRILVAESGTGRILDITEPGDVSDKTTVFSGVPRPYGLTEVNGEIFVTFSNGAMAGMSRVEPGGEFPGASAAFVRDFPVVLSSEPYPEMRGCGGSWVNVYVDGRLLFCHKGLGAIFDATDGGTFMDLREQRFAWGLDAPLGMWVDPVEDRLLVVEQGTGVVKRLAREGGYSRFAEPVLAGFDEPSCVRISLDGTAMFVCDRARGTVYKADVDYVIPS